MQENSMKIIQSSQGFSELVPKNPTPKKTAKKLSESARGEYCRIMFDGICNGDNDTVVYAHLRDGSLQGFGMSSKGIWGCPACSNCHRILDGGTGILERDFVHHTHRKQTIRYWDALRGKVWVLL